MAKEKKPRKSNKLTAVPKPRKPKKVTLFDTELEPLKEAESILTDVEKAEARAEEAALHVEMAKESYQTARLAYKDAVGQLRKLCRARKEKHPLFDQAAAKKPEDKPAAKADLVAVAVTVTAGTEQHGIAKGTLAPIWLVKPGGILVMAGETPTAITDEEYTADEPVAALIAEAREKKITSDADAWREFVAGKQTPPATNPQVDESWKALPLEAAKINGRGGKLLAEAGYETLGAVAKLMRDYGQWWNKEVKGIGEETAAEISDRFADFWSAHPEYCRQAEAC